MGASFTLGCPEGWSYAGANLHFTFSLDAPSRSQVAGTILLGKDCCPSLHADASSSLISCDPDQDVCKAHESVHIYPKWAPDSMSRCIVVGQRSHMLAVRLTKPSRAHM